MEPDTIYILLYLSFYYFFSIPINISIGITLAFEWNEIGKFEKIWNISFIITENIFIILHLIGMFFCCSIVVYTFNQHRIKPKLENTLNSTIDFLFFIGCLRLFFTSIPLTFSCYYFIHHLEWNWIIGGYSIYLIFRSLIDISWSIFFYCGYNIVK